MNIQDVEYVTEILHEIQNKFRDELDEPIPIDIAVKLKRDIRNIEEVLEIVEADSGN